MFDLNTPNVTGDVSKIGAEATKNIVDLADKGVTKAIVYGGLVITAAYVGYAIWRGVYKELHSQEPTVFHRVVHESKGDEKKE